MAENVGKLEEELKRKGKGMEDLLQELKLLPTRLSKEQAEGKVTAEELKAKLEAIKEMQMEILQKKEGLEKALREVGEEMRSLEELRAKPEKGEIQQAMKALAERAKGSRERLEKAIKEMDGLRERYAKKFLGKEG